MVSAIRPSRQKDQQGNCRESCPVSDARLNTEEGRFCDRGGCEAIVVTADAPVLGNREKHRRAASDYAADRIKGGNLIGGGVLVSYPLLEVAEYVFQRNLKKSMVSKIGDCSNQN